MPQTKWPLWLLASTSIHTLVCLLLFWHTHKSVYTQSIPIEFTQNVFTQTDQATSSNMKAEHLTDALHQIAKNMSQMMTKRDLGNLKLVKTPDHHSRTILNSLQNKLSQPKNTSLNTAIKENIKWDLYADKATGNLSQKDMDRISNIFRSLQGNFRNCYENALLKDETLSLTVQYEAQVEESGGLSAPSFSMMGHSTPDGEQTLKNCLTKVLDRVRVGHHLSGVRIKNEFIFKS